MSLKDIRNNNIENVTRVALEMFVKNGIEKTKISDIAQACNLTERSIFRYFETKADLVLAAAQLFWKMIVRSSQQVYEQMEPNLLGVEQIEYILKAYAHQFFYNKEQLIFIQETEVYLYRCHKKLLEEQKPINFLKNSQAPLNKAILKGLEDKSITNKNIEMLYYIVYDSLLGLMQKMATGIYGDLCDENEQMKRLDYYCEMLVDTFF